MVKKATYFLAPCLTAIAALEKVFVKKAADSLSHYGIFLSEIIVLQFFLVFGAVVLYKRKFTSDITPEMIEFPKRKLALIAVIDTIAGILVLIPSGRVDGGVMTLVMQSVVILTMAGSALFLGARIPPVKYLAAVVIIAGIAVNVGPHFSLAGDGWYVVPLLLSTIPQAASGLVQESILHGTEIDVYYFQFNVAAMQLLVGLIVSPGTFLLSDPNAHLDDLPSSLLNGALCWIPGATPHDATPAIIDQCHNAFPAVTVYTLVCVVFNLLVTLTIAKSTAVTMMVALIVAVPIQYFAFSIHIPFFVEHPTPLTKWNYIGLSVAFLGLVLFNFSDIKAQLYPPPEDKQDSPGRLLGDTESAARPAASAAGPVFRHMVSPAMMRSPAHFTPQLRRGSEVYAAVVDDDDADGPRGIAGSLPSRLPFYRNL